jgi:hypothetical protein
MFRNLTCNRIAWPGLLVLLATLISPAVHAQLLRGSISGTAVDPQDALVSDVTVTVKNQETGEVTTTTTNESGFYRVAADPGSYSVEFVREGFATQKSGAVEVKASKDTTVDAKLVIGVISSQVFVSVPGMELDKSNATVRLNLPGRILDEIPMPTSTLVPAGSRNFSRYALFAPGVSRVLFQNETSANGHRGRENNFMIDGTDNNDQTVTLPSLFIPPEAIQEVDVQAATFSAEYGRNIGAQINVITRRGTNSYTGQLWEFYRGNALEPLALSDAKAGLQKAPRLVDNQFGGSIGGPIIKNKTFFFGLLQGNLLRTGPRAASTVTIPTPTGYAALQTAPLRSGQSAASRQAMLDALNFLPEIHSTVQSYSSIDNTYTVNGTPIERGTFTAVIPTRQNIWYSTIRVDHQLSENDRLTFRSHIDRRISPLSSGNLAFGERWAADTKYFAQNHFIGYTKNIGPRFVNEARLTYSRLFPTAEERDPVSQTVIITNNFQIGGNRNFPQERLEQTWQFQNVSTYILARHSLKFGVDLSRNKLISNTGQDAKGTWTFPNLQDFMNSQPSRLDFLASVPQRYQFYQLRQAYFVQDDFKVTRTLTTSLGLRYETSDIPLGFFGATTAEVLNALVPGPVRRDTNNWGPRVGFSYAPEFDSGLLGSVFGVGKSAIRGGFGIGHDVLFYSLLAFPSLNYPRTNAQALTGGSAPVDQFPTLPAATTVPTLSATTSFVNLPSDSQNPTSHYWSLSIQRQLRNDYFLEIGYNGNRSYHLIRQGQANPGVLSEAKAAAVIAGCTASTLSTCQDPSGFPTSPSRLNPSWGSRTTLETTGKSAYHGMYVQLNGRTPFGLRFGANYTWSTTLSDSEEFSNDSAGAGDGGLASSSPQVPQSFFDQRNEWSRSVFDRPHRATFNYTYQIPWFRSSPVVLEHIFKGWQWSGFTELQSGQPFTIRIGVDALGSGTAVSARPDYNPDGILIGDPVTNNLRTFVIPRDGTGIVTAPHVTSPTGTITFLKNSMPNGGTLGRNTFRGPGYANFNMSLAKHFTLPGERQLQIRGDFLNVFNHDNFPNPDANMTSSTFGKWATPRLLTDARQVLLGAKLSF